MFNLELYLALDFVAQYVTVLCFVQGKSDEVVSHYTLGLNKNNVLGRQFLIFLPKNPGK